MFLTPSVFAARMECLLALLTSHSGCRNCLCWSLKSGAVPLLLTEPAAEASPVPHIVHGYKWTVPTLLRPHALSPLPPTAAEALQPPSGTQAAAPRRVREVTLGARSTSGRWQPMEKPFSSPTHELSEDKVASYDLSEDVLWHWAFSFSSSVGQLSNTPLQHTCPPSFPALPLLWGDCPP